MSLNFFAQDECVIQLTLLTLVDLTLNPGPAHITWPLCALGYYFFLSLKPVPSELLWHCCLVMSFLYHQILLLSISPGPFSSRPWILVLSEAHPHCWACCRLHSSSLHCHFHCYCFLPRSHYFTVEQFYRLLTSSSNLLAGLFLIHNADRMILSKVNT